VEFYHPAHPRLLAPNRSCYHRLVDAAVVSVIIVSYESRDTIAACLASVAAHAGMRVETIVVDNASRDGTVALIRDQFPDVQVIAQTENRGFAAGSNAGARIAVAPYLLFLNPDAELCSGALSALRAHLEASPRVAAAGPRFIYPDGTSQDGAFRYPTLLMTWLEFFPRPGRILHGSLNGRFVARDGMPIEVDHPLGACMLVRRTAWADVGPFDEAFFLYCEEVDWCTRAKRHGWAISHVPAATVIHHGGHSSGSTPAASLAYLYRSRQRLHAKHRGRAFRLAVRCITRLGLMHERRRLRRLLATADGTEDRESQRLGGVEQALRELRV
jgi:N-acetylglucosaminyl-diphospho-decaprenol L-rhamnosyltransferase